MKLLDQSYVEQPLYISTGGEVKMSSSMRRRGPSSSECVKVEAEQWSTPPHFYLGDEFGHLALKTK